MKPQAAKKPAGTFIVLEGTDGSGKGTQFELLTEKLKKDGYDVATFDFPQYENDSSHFVKEYLNGNYGSATDVGPYTGSLFYALDRYSASFEIKQALEEGKVVLANRYTGSNMAHQGTKFQNPAQRRGYFLWLDNLEFEMLKIPRPDKSFVLRVPAETAQKLVDQKSKRSYTDKKRDIHEADLNHLKLSVQVYDELCMLFPKDFSSIDCTRDKQLMSIEQISELLYKVVQPILPSPKQKNKEYLSSIPTETQAKKENEYVQKTEEGWKILPAGEDFLKGAVTSTVDNVYAFTDKLNALTVAAAMARLSRRGDDMRITILDEFANASSKDEKLLRRVITAFGDDSVQQLVGQHVVVEGASNLLTKKLEWGRLASYLEQSTRYIYFDQKENGEYKYYTPDHFDATTKKYYKNAIDNIFDTYSELVHKLTDFVRSNSKVAEDERDIAWKGATRAQACDAARSVLPVSTKSTVGIYASGQALESLIMHLLGDDLKEAQQTGKKLLDHARKTIPVFLERADKPDRGGATIAYNATTRHSVKMLSEQYLPVTLPIAETEDVKLDSYWPRNELDLIADMLYEHSSESLDSIKKSVSMLSIAQKENVMKTYFGERLNRRHKPGRALEKAHYNWDLVCDYGIFRDLQRHRIVDDLEWQKLSPRFGYEIPKLVDDAGLEDLFEKCFDISLELYSYLQEAGYQLDAQYATLLGHKMRWKVTYNAREAFHLHELRTSPQGHPGYRKLVLQMHEKLAEVHPLIADAMLFVNKGEDPELSRLAAEKYTQFKLNQI
jgi:thymidylate kinase/thymidylate synthase ThyX